MNRMTAETSRSELRLTGAEIAASVSERELLRLLELPRARELEGELGARADQARAWYAERGRPFVGARRIDVEHASPATVMLAGGSQLRSTALAGDLRETRGHAVVVLAVSAGREVAAEVSRAWAEDRPDEAYFLDRFAAAVTEALVLQAAAAECRTASGAGETLLPPHSPGCAGFEIGDQQRLMALLGATPAGERLALGPIELLPTGALDPPHTLVAVLGVTRRRLTATTPEDLCRRCALDPCSFRRAPWGGGSRAPLSGVKVGA